MKRRNADCGKLRRPLKRNKITESMYGSTTVLYMKFLVLWAIVITADFMFMFRFEFLWPFWLLLRSVHDSFKYKGLAFSVLFVCIAITSDFVCLFFIPVHWLLFAASTYVWVQYVWHTDKGICLPTIILWMLFVYLEAGIRWKDSRHIPHLDLCRPFAAHCIGYPVVTLGFGFKSYVGYRMRQRKQREVAKENEFYMQLLQQALPQEDPVVSAVPAIVDDSHTTTIVGCHTAAAISVANNTQNVQTHHHHMHHHNHHHANTNNTNSSNNNHITPGGAANSINTNTQLGSAVTTANGSTVMVTSATTTAQNNHHLHHQNNSLHQQASQDQQQHMHHNVSSNGHVGGKNHRRNFERENKNRPVSGAETTGGSSLMEAHNKHNNNNHKNSNNNNSYHQLHTADTHHKDKSEWDAHNSNCHQSLGGGKEKENSNNNNKHESTTKGNTKRIIPITPYSGVNGGNINQNEADDAVIVEPVEKQKVGRRNRSKKENASKDNHHIHYNQHSNNNNNSTSNNNSSNNSNQNTNNNCSNKENPSISSVSHSHNNRNSDASSVSSSSSVTSSSHSSSDNSATSTITHLASKVVSHICDSCVKFEAELKKYRTEILHMKQIENEVRQKLDANMTTKSCLQAKQKECDELEKRIHELTNARHADMLQLQTIERRLAEERRQKQSVDALLNNEKKARKLAEEKAARPECSIQCKQRKQAMEEEIKQLRRELKLVEEGKQLAEQHGRKWEQELRMFEAEIRNRDSIQPGTEVLMNALAAMQDKNCTLEKNLSAETRVKLDLFSALGDAKRQLEISESLRRSKEDEVHDLKAKIAQLLAVMPTDSLCLPACSSTGASSMLRMNDTPPLQTGPGPASPILNSMTQAQQQQMGGRVNSKPTSDYVPQSMTSDYVTSQKQQQQCVGMVPVSVATSVLVSGPQVSNGSNLDPNATAYTPKSGGNVVVVGNVSGGDA